MFHPLLNKPAHQLSVGDLVDIANELDGSWTALSQLSQKHPEWSTLLLRLFARHAQPLSLSENSQAAPASLLYELLGMFESSAYYKSGTDPMVWDSPRHDYDERLSLQQVYCRCGSKVVYKLLEAGGYYATPA